MILGILGKILIILDRITTDHFRALELSMSNYGKNGRPQNWPRVLSPTLNGINYSAHHSYYTDQIIANIFGPSFKDFSASQPFHIDCKKLNEFWYAKLFDEFKTLLTHGRLTFLTVKMTLSLHQKSYQTAD